VAAYGFLALVIAIVVVAIRWPIDDATWKDYETCKGLATSYTGEFDGCMQHFRAKRGG
jgi:hypothetical protein